MNATIIKLALRALLGRRRFWLLLALPIALIGLTVLIRVLSSEGDAAWPMVSFLGYPLVLPLVAILAASSVLGPEVDDGSIVYLLSKPVSRHAIAISKWLVARAATLVVGALGVFVAGPGRGRWLAGRRLAGGRAGRRDDLLRVLPGPVVVHAARRRGRADLRPDLGGPRRRLPQRHRPAQHRAVGHPDRALGLVVAGRPRQPAPGRCSPRWSSPSAACGSPATGCGRSR
ncbi:ABC transporter permease [Nocardioides sp. B-3]|uniref:ABC transporter permease n=1 Tax=Nocardioides sp. B-3 TaxID=2895565 RepID=UPI002152705B|nr:ABC transporter permease [Nocardioides sp. B-3]UUZ60451.1 ABC transporter permease [Nocardioides sp. B-3]